MLACYYFSIFHSFIHPSYSLILIFYSKIRSTALCLPEFAVLPIYSFLFKILLTFSGTTLFLFFQPNSVVLLFFNPNSIFILYFNLNSLYIYGTIPYISTFLNTTFTFHPYIIPYFYSSFITVCLCIIYLFTIYPFPFPFHYLHLYFHLYFSQFSDSAPFFIFYFTKLSSTFFYYTLL